MNQVATAVSTQTAPQPKPPIKAGGALAALVPQKLWLW